MSNPESGNKKKASSANVEQGEEGGENKKARLAQDVSTSQRPDAQQFQEIVAEAYKENGERKNASDARRKDLYETWKGEKIRSGMSLQNLLESRG